MLLSLMVGRALLPQKQETPHNPRMQALGMAAKREGLTINQYLAKHNPIKSWYNS